MGQIGGSWQGGRGNLCDSSFALVAQLAEATVSNTVKCRFESDLGHAVVSTDPGERAGAVAAQFSEHDR